MADETDNFPLTEPYTKNLSTEHQEKGSAKRPSDTLDRDPADVHPARDFDFANDAGKAEPGGGTNRPQDTEQIGKG